MYDNLDTTKRLLLYMNSIADWRFALGMHIQFANPTLLYQNYPPQWIKHYNDEGLVFLDPAVRWAVANTGICDWSNLADDDGDNVLGQAADYGLRFGKAVSIIKETRTFGFFAHSLREIKNPEIEEAQVVLEKIHDATKGVDLLSGKDLASFRELNTVLS